ncbi:MAG: M1 family metallopeptidase [Cyclobacteriaceae bacterium]|nr:M1 family metallopeptidase [Cyclobacteriaceae bacterium]
MHTYLAEAENKKVDLIRFNYDDSDDMFDSHSYAKGGLILHALRKYIGDEAFFASLTYYLKTHAFGKAEIHDLRLAFEHITGEDLIGISTSGFLLRGTPNCVWQKPMTP